MVALNNGELRRYTAAGGGPYTASIPVGKPSRLFARGSSAYLETSAADADAPFCVLYSVDPGTAASPPVLSELTRVDWADGIEPLSAGNYAYRLNAREGASRKYRDIVIAIAGDIRVITPTDAALLAPK
jgi:hypothetical protein